MDKIKRIVTKNLLVIIFVTFFLGFTSFAVWDVKEIIRDYIEDNSVTAVRVKTSAVDGYPFLGKPTVCLEYDQPIIPGLTWDEFYFMFNDSWHQREIAWSTNMSDWETSESRKFFNTIKYMLVENIGKGLIYLIDETANLLRINSTDFMVLVDSFIEKADLLDNVTIDLNKFNWFIYRKTLTTSNDITPINLVTYETGSSQLKLCFSIPLSDDSTTLKQKWVTYHLNTNYRSVNATKANIRIEFLRENRAISKTETNYGTTNILVQISNSRIYDNKRTGDCKREFKNRDDCLSNLRQAKIEEICQCKQLTLIKESKSKRKLCTMRIYEKCLLHALKEKDRERIEAIRTNACKACTSATSNIGVIVDPTQGWNNSASYSRYWYPRYRLSFEFKDETYLVYEEKPQFSFPQLVSQIGGDLGLYLGFSMISVLQLILFFYHMFRQRSKSGQINGSKLRKLRDALQFYFRYVIRSVKSEVEDNSLNLLELKERVRTIELKQQVALKEFNEWKKKLEQRLLNKTIQKQQEDTFEELINDFKNEMRSMEKRLIDQFGHPRSSATCCKLQIAEKD